MIDVTEDVYLSMVMGPGWVSARAVLNPSGHYRGTAPPLDGPLLERADAVACTMLGVLDGCLDRVQTGDTYTYKVA